MSAGVSRTAVTAALALGTALAGCDLPRDPEGTLERVRGGVLRAGVCEIPPWVVREGDRPLGVEPALLQRFAAGLDARIEWQWGSAEEHLAALEHHRLDLAACGLERSTPWRKRVGLTLPYHVERRPPDAPGGRTAEHVLAVPPGENAWLVALERFLVAERSGVAPLLAAAEEKRAVRR
jgi:hypothetical protein